LLKTLAVKNFALIESATIEFTDGLNVLTGETGSGKSILIDALGLILGNRASVEYIRQGCDALRVEAVFDVGNLLGVKRILEDQAIPLEEDQSLIISRTLTRTGKNTILANGCHITLNTLRQIGQRLVDIHGQHENQALLRQDTYLGFVDSHDPQIASCLAEYQKLYRQWEACVREYDNLQNTTRERMQRLDILQWQTQEIAAAGLKADEEEQLAQEVKILTNAEKIASSVNKAYALLSQGSKGVSSVLDQLAETSRELDAAARFDQKLAPISTVITECLYQLEEAARELRDYKDSFDYQPQDLARLQERMDVIYKLKRKYGPTVADVLAYYQQALAELATLENSDQHLAQLKELKDRLEDELSTAADKLDKLRRQAAKDLEEAVGAHLRDLGMADAKLLIQTVKTDHFTARGRNEVELLFSANPGEEPKRLSKIASGGELSRVALAIKAVHAGHDDMGTMIFDEVDAGVGGATGQRVAEKIALVAGQKQVLCVTHLPQIACMADQHLYVEKKVANERTYAQVRLLQPQERLYEITRMISGSAVTQAAIDNAAEMLHQASKIKEKWKNKAQA